MPSKRVRLDQLKPGPIRHPALSPLLIARIKSVRSTLDEVFFQSLEQWLDGFQRDADPESEIAWWERLARCYTGYTSKHELNLKQKQAAFKVIFGLAMDSPTQDVQAGLAYLPQGALEEIAGIMRASIAP